MTTFEIVTGLVEAVLCYFLLWFGLDSIQKKRNPKFAAAVLLVIGYAAFVVSPWVRDTDAWRRLVE